MTTVEISSSSLKAVGHAGYSTSGKDIICASVSILCFQLANILLNEEEKQEKPPVTEIKDGYFFINAFPKKECEKEIETIFRHCAIGFRLLEDEYSDFIRCIWGGEFSEKNNI
jgi:uncharacterized protein YsxB (DUF464 family)